MSSTPTNLDIIAQVEKHNAIASTLARSISFFIAIGLTAYGLFWESQTSNLSIILGIFGLVVSLTIDRITDGWSTYQSRLTDRAQFEQSLSTARDNLARIEGNIGVLSEKIFTRFNIEYLESESTIMQRIDELSSAANRIRNTFIGIDEPHINAPQIVKIYNDFLSRDRTKWSDIITLNELFSERYNNISPNGPIRNNMHELVVVRHSPPIINFIIFEFPGGRASEVMFGWTHDRHHGETNIFLTSEPKLVSTFRNMFINLWERKALAHIVVDYNHTKPARLNYKTTFKPVDKQGVWYTHSYNNEELTSVAVFVINFIDGLPRIEGIVANNSDFDNLETIEHRKIDRIDHSAEKIYVEYRRAVGATNYEGFVLYKFLSHKRIDIISGFISDQYSRRHNDLVGTRVPDELHIGMNLFQKEILSKIHAQMNPIVQEVRRERRGV